MYIHTYLRMGYDLPSVHRPVHCVLPIRHICYRVARFVLVQTYQNGKNITNDHKLYKDAIYYTKYSKWSWNITIFSIPRPSKFYPNWDFGFESKPSGNPDLPDLSFSSSRAAFQGRRVCLLSRFTSFGREKNRTDYF
jgi:hypothetical protein